MKRGHARILPVWLMLFNIAVVVVVVMAFAFYFGPRLEASVRVTEGAILRSAMEAVHPVRDFLYKSPSDHEADGRPYIRMGYFVHPQENETPEGIGARYTCALILSGYPSGGRIILSAYQSDGTLLMSADFRMPVPSTVDCENFSEFIDYANPDWRTH